MTKTIEGEYTLVKEEIIHGNDNHPETSTPGFFSRSTYGIPNGAIIVVGWAFLGAVALGNISSQVEHSVLVDQDGFPAHVCQLNPNEKEPQARIYIYEGNGLYRLSMIADYSGSATNDNDGNAVLTLRNLRTSLPNGGWALRNGEIKVTFDQEETRCAATIVSGGDLEIVNGRFEMNKPVNLNAFQIGSGYKFPGLGN